MSEAEFGFQEAEERIMELIFNKGLPETLVRAKQEVTDTEAHLAGTISSPENRAYNEGRLRAYAEFVSRYTRVAVV